MRRRGPHVIVPVHDGRAAGSCGPRATREWGKNAFGDAPLQTCVHARTQSRRATEELELVRLFVTIRDRCGSAEDRFESSSVHDFSTLHSPDGANRMAAGPGASDTIAQRLKDCVEMTHFAAAFEPFLFAAAEMRLLPGDVLVTLRAALLPMLRRDWSMRDVSEAVGVIFESLDRMHPFALIFVDKLRQHGALMQFVASFDALGPAAFDRQASVVTARMQGRPYESGLVNELCAAVRVMRLFTPLPPAADGSVTARYASLPELHAALATISASEERASAETAVEQQIELLQSLSGHVQELKGWFADGATEDASAVLARIVGYCGSGGASFASSSSGSENAGRGELVLVYNNSAQDPSASRLADSDALANNSLTDADSDATAAIAPSGQGVLGSELLAELVRAAVLSQGGENTDEAVAAQLASFVAAYRSAGAAHDLRMQLQDAGHPLFNAVSGSNSTSSLSVLSGGINVSIFAPEKPHVFAYSRGFHLQAAALDTLSSQFAALLGEWLTLLERTLRENRRLLLLGAAAMLRLVRLCCRPDIDAQAVIPYVLLWCVPLFNFPGSICVCFFLALPFFV